MHPPARPGPLGPCALWHTAGARFLSRGCEHVSGLGGKGPPERRVTVAESRRLTHPAAPPFLAGTASRAGEARQARRGEAKPPGPELGSLGHLDSQPLLGQGTLRFPDLSSLGLCGCFLAAGAPTPRAQGSDPELTVTSTDPAELPDP